RVRPPPHRHRCDPADHRAAHLRRRRRGRVLAARPHRVPRGRGRGREHRRPPRGGRRRGAPLHLHRPGGRLRRADRGPGPRAVRGRRDPHRALPVLGHRPGGDVRGPHRLREDDPRDAPRRAARRRGGGPLGDRDHQRRRAGHRLGGARRHRGRLDGRPPDARRGVQGGRAGRARAAAALPAGAQEGDRRGGDVGPAHAMTAGATGRAGWLRRVGPWVGIGTSPAALMTGGGVAQGMEGWVLPVAIVVGVLVLATLAAAQGLIGQRSGRPLLTLSADALGPVASRRTAAPVMLAMMVGWFALNTNVAGAALGRLVGLPDRAGIVLFAAAMLAVVWAGVEWLSWSALAAGAASAALAAYGAWIVLADRDVSLTGDGHPAHPVGFAQSVAVVVGYGAAFALRSPDFTRDLARARHVVWCAVVGIALPVVAFALTGA